MMGTAVRSCCSVGMRSGIVRGSRGDYEGGGGLLTNFDVSLENDPYCRELILL